VSTSQLARLVTERVPALIFDWSVVVILGFAENIVVPFLFISTVVVPLQAVPNHILTCDIV